MRTKSRRLSSPRWALAPNLVLLAALLGPPAAFSQEARLTVTVGPADADVIGADNHAIQKAIDRVAAAGGGTVVIKAGTYLLANSVRLASHLTLRGEGPDKTLLKKIPGVRSKLKLDADYGEMIATVEDVRGFTPGMGVTILDKASPGGWTPSVRTIVRIEGNSLYFDRFLQMDYSVANQGEVFNTFPLIAGFGVTDLRVEGLTVDGSRADSVVLDGCQAAGIYFFHSQRLTIRNCVARNYPGDGIGTQYVEDPVVDNCEVYGNAQLGIHLGTGALHGIVRHNRAHDNGQDGLYLCWRVKHALYEGNQSWNNGRDGISLGHKDTDNLFVKNTASGNGRAGIYFRDESAANAASRNTFEENLIEDNGRPDAPGYGIRIEGETRDLRFVSNTIRSNRKDDVVVQPVGIYIGPKADYVTSERNLFVGNLKQAIVNESQGGHDQLAPPVGR
ncbi:MAG: right-handed parallel beta-helix repeat-containing protein [Acidobacteriia bacterium]|nr:right-handed parallel beta-helix repeat-containing protein [Terriglobia bacterium]